MKASFTKVILGLALTSSLPAFGQSLVIPNSDPQVSEFSRIQYQRMIQVPDSHRVIGPAADHDSISRELGASYTDSRQVLQMIQQLLHGLTTIEKESIELKALIDNKTLSPQFRYSALSGGGSAFDRELYFPSRDNFEFIAIEGPASLIRLAVDRLSNQDWETLKSSVPKYLIASHLYATKPELHVPSLNLDVELSQGALLTELLIKELHQLGHSLDPRPLTELEKTPGRIEKIQSRNFDLIELVVKSGVLNQDQLKQLIGSLTWTYSERFRSSRGQDIVNLFEKKSQTDLLHSRVIGLVSSLDDSQLSQDDKRQAIEDLLSYKGARNKCSFTMF